MIVHRLEWRTAVERYVRDALALLEETEDAPRFDPASSTSWVRAGPTQFRRPITWVGPSGGILAWRKIEAIPSFHALRDLLINDAVAGPQFDTLVGTAYGRGRHNLTRVLENLVLRAVVERQTSYEFDDTVFDHVYSKWEADVLSATIPVIQCVPVIGIALMPGEEIPAAEGADYRKMSDNEIGRCLSAGVIPLSDDFGSDTSRYVPEWMQCGVISVTNLPKITGDDVDPPFPLPQLPDVHGAADRIVAAIRLASGARCARGAVLQWHDERDISGWSIRNAPPIAAELTAGSHLTVQAVESLKVMAARLQSPLVARDKALNVVIRRIVDAGHRYDPVDTLLDLMIAAEGLFLTDTGDPAERGELSFRLALRAAVFTPAHIPPRAVMRFFRHAYRVRSAMVHGGTPRANDVVTLDGARTDLMSMVRAFDELMVAATRKAVVLRSSNDKTLYKWDDKLAALLGDLPVGDVGV